MFIIIQRNNVFNFDNVEAYEAPEGEDNLIALYFINDEQPFEVRYESKSERDYDFQRLHKLLDAFYL